MQIPVRAQERAAKNYCVSGDCWQTTYSIGSHGYGQIGWTEGGKTHVTTVHRAAWTYHNGPIPAPMTVDHVCHNRKCVNPAHLQLLTNQENAIKNRIDYDPDYCKRGHRRRPDEVGSGKGCQECKNEWTRKWRAA